MEIDFDVTVTKSALYDYLLYHTYTGFAGIIGTVVGALLLVGFFLNGKIVYLIAGLIIVLYLPCTLFLRSRQQYMLNPAFKEPFHYHVGEEGITVSQNETEETIAWDQILKAVSTPGNILLYTSRVNASILPKKDLGDKKEALIRAVSTHVEPARVKIRG